VRAFGPLGNSQFNTRVLRVAMRRSRHLL
jgi:hypothetical protein